MQSKHWRTTGLLASFTLVATLTATVSQAKQPPFLVPVSTYDTGLAENGAEIISIRKKDNLGALTNVAGSIDILDLSDPAQIVLLRRVTLDPTLGTPNSVALHPKRDYFLVVSGSSGKPGTISAYRTSDGMLLTSASVGILPDSVDISGDGRYAVVANEAEGVSPGDNGGEGSLSVIDLKGFNPANPSMLSVTQVALPSQNGVPGFSTGRTDDAARLAVDNTPGTLEPETVTFSPNDRYAYITLQENSGVVRLELATLALTFYGTGQTTHPADLTNDGKYNPVETLTLYREPDGIAVDPNGRFFVTADEGDTRDANGKSGPRGGRTVSVFSTYTGNLISDTGNQIDDAAAAAGLYPDNRSDRGGSEPEVLDITNYRGRTLVAVGLERANGVALIDVTYPAAPIVLGVTPVGAGPEGIKFFRKGQTLYVLSANEVAGTLSVLQVSF